MFHDRSEAALMLTKKLEKYRGEKGVVMAIPRGGVPIGFRIAKQLRLPLEVMLTKKIGHPYNKEFAIGSVSLYGATVDEKITVPDEYLKKETERIRKSLRVSHKIYCGDQKPADVARKTVIITDDGVATGNTILAAADILRKRSPAKIVIAVPVLPFEKVEELKRYADNLVYVIAPYDFAGVGQFYENFPQLTDEEVIFFLSESQHA
jgi:predicted phosphoribosyltransferase